MSDFEAKIHRSRCRLGLSPDPDRGAYRVGGPYSAPQSTSWNKGDLLLREGKGRGARREGVESDEKAGKGRGEEGKRGDERRGNGQGPPCVSLNFSYNILRAQHYRCGDQLVRKV